jgi:hypothetical protein
MLSPLVLCCEVVQHHADVAVLPMQLFGIDFHPKDLQLAFEAK